MSEGKELRIGEILMRHFIVKSDDGELERVGCLDLGTLSMDGS